MVIGLIDIIVLITIVLSVLCALYHGLVRELLGISSWILAGICALYGYTPMQSLMQRFIDNDKIAGVAGAALVALIVLVIMTLINAKITSRLRASALSGLDRTLGFLFGVLRALLLIALVYIGASMVMSRGQLAELKKENMSIPYIQKMAKGLEKFMPEGLKKDLHTPHWEDDIVERAEKSSETEMQDLKKHVKRAVQKKQETVQKQTKKTVKTLSDPSTYKKSDRELMDDMVESILAEE